jgi:hypothetical protein
MASIRRESGLSEVVGFILIIALIAAVASLYITYVVPAQGRQNEIAHMQYVQDQFTGYKISMDSLWVNGRKDVTLSRTIELGTIGGKTQGSSFINLPLFSPFGSSGTMVVNGRTDTITYAFPALITEGYPGNYIPNYSSLQGEPDHLYINFLTNNASKGGGVLLTPSVGDWYIWLNSTQFISTSTDAAPVGTLPPLPGAAAPDISSWITTYLIPWSSSVNSTIMKENDLTITVVKNGKPTLSNWIIKRNLQANTHYTIDLLDPAYGLDGSFDYDNFNLIAQNSSYPWISTTYPLSYGYNETSFISPPQRIGSLEYISNNNYWIQQDYIYQDGGVFLFQPGESAGVVKILPSITLTKTPSNLIIVQITDIVIGSSTQSLGGTSPVEVTGFVEDQSADTINGVVIARGIPNAQRVDIYVNAEDIPTAKMWEGAFQQIQALGIQNGVPGNWSAVSRSGAQCNFTITGDPLHPNDYDIMVKYARVNLSTSIQTVAI